VGNRRFGRSIGICLAFSLLAAQSVGAQTGVRWLFIVDDYHIDFANTGRMRDQVRSIATQLLRPEDTFAMQCTGPSRANFEWTSDRSTLDAGIRSLTGNGLKFADLLAIAAGTQPPDGREAQAVATVVGILDGLDPFAGPIGIIYVSNGYAALPEALGSAASRTAVPIFAVDPRLMGTLIGALEPRDEWNAYWTVTRQTLQALADASGGILLESRSGLPAAARKFGELVRR
jgi:hypothetical protein